MSYSGKTNCMRCGLEIGHPNNANADYIIAAEFIVQEPREQFYAITIDAETKVEKEIKVKTVSEGLAVPKVERVIAKMEDEEVQKGAVICPDCYNPDTDFIIWGVHKIRNT